MLVLHSPLEIYEHPLKHGRRKREDKGWEYNTLKHGWQGTPAGGPGHPHLPPRGVGTNLADDT